MSLIDAQKERAAHARRLAQGIANQSAVHSLTAYAEEIEAEVEKLEAQAAVIKQTAAQAEQATAPEQSIAAVKPPSEPDTST
jgi:hypothetical protein